MKTREEKLRKQLEDAIYAFHEMVFNPKEFRIVLYTNLVYYNKWSKQCENAYYLIDMSDGDDHVFENGKILVSYHKDIDEYYDGYSSWASIGSALNFVLDMIKNDKVQKIYSEIY